MHSMLVPTQRLLYNPDIIMHFAMYYHAVQGLRQNKGQVSRANWASAMDKGIKQMSPWKNHA